MHLQVRSIEQLGAVTGIHSAADLSNIAHYKYNDKILYQPKTRRAM